VTHDTIVSVAAAAGGASVVPQNAAFTRMTIYAWWCAALCVLVLALTMRSTLAALVATWLRSRTFAHGALIAPIVAWLIYRQRHELALLEARPTLVAVPLMLLLSLAWYIARIAGAMVVDQLLAVIGVSLIALGILGPAILRRMAFPLTFLLLAVPFGEWLIPPMMEFTANFTVAALRFCGVPVLRDGLYFSIPSGDFLIAEACSGIRYLMASLALGALYAYLIMRSPWRRAVLIAISIVLPVIANGIRAFGIVALAHLSDMRIAVGADHLVYGWLFFAALAALLLWIGGRMAKRETAIAPAALETVPSQPASPRHLVLVTASMCAAMLTGPLLASAQAARTAALQSAFVPHFPATVGSWEAQPLPEPTVTPLFHGFDASVAVRYSTPAMDGQAHEPIEAWLAYYEVERTGHELVRDDNRFFDESKYGIAYRAAADAESSHDPLPPRTMLRIRGASGDWIVWYWYQVGRIETNRAAYVKILSAIDALAAPYDGRSALALYTRAVPDADSATRRLESFLGQARSELAVCATPADAAACRTP